jgi:hypothetical protein
MARDKSSKQLIAEIFEACRHLSELSGRPVSPDGHLVGSLGEIFAAETLGLRLMPPSNHGFDALGPHGEKVEIKTTTRSSISLSNEPSAAERLVVVVLDHHGAGQVLFDGAMDSVLAVAGPPQKNGQRRVSISRIISPGVA